MKEYDKEFLILVFREHLDFNVKFEPLKILPSKDKERSSALLTELLEEN